MINFLGLYIFAIFIVAGFSARASIASSFREFDNTDPLVRLFFALYLSFLTIADLNAVFSKAPLISGTFGFLLDFPRFFVTNGILLWVHEGGHAALSWAGKFIHILGGTLFQIGVPALLTYLCYRNKFQVATLLGVWIVGTACFMSVLYVWDASARELPLLGASDAEGHDWGNMLTMLGLLRYEKVIGYLFLIAGVGLEVMGIVGLALSSPKKNYQ